MFRALSPISCGCKPAYRVQPPYVEIRRKCWEKAETATLTELSSRSLSCAGSFCSTLGQQQG
jgi:hypothetical protein